MILPSFHLVEPSSRLPLQFAPLQTKANLGYLFNQESSQRWPVAFGIPFLRGDRAELAEQVVELFVSQKLIEGVGLLLQVTDEFAPCVPDLVDCERVAEQLLADALDLDGSEFMAALQYGPVGHYFALRGSAPTFFSGLGLLKLGAKKEHPLMEVGCGVGHFLYWLQERGVEAMGLDAVFSKLCLAHHFLKIRADRLVCARAGIEAQLPVVTVGPTSVFCHDAFYFFEDKRKVLIDFRRLAGKEGSVLVGHAHLAAADHGKVSGHPLGLGDYKMLAGARAHFFDDAGLVAFGSGTGPVNHEIPDLAEAISFVEGTLSAGEASWGVGREERHHAPLEVAWSSTEQRTSIKWPSQAFAREYRSADYLVTSQNPFEHLPTAKPIDPLVLHPGLAVPAPFFTLGVRPLRWGVIGGGWIAADYFMPAFAWTPQAKLVGVAEPNEKRREALAGIRGVQVFADWREMISEGRLDAVYIATPPDAHAEIFAGAAAAGLRVLCEKPLATNQQDLQRMKDCVRQTPDLFQTAYDQRYHPAHLRLARKIAEGALGTVTQIRIHYACWVDGLWNKATATDHWRIDPERAGGGAGFDLLPHGLDLFSVLAHDSIAQANLLYQGRVHDYAVHGKMDDGALMAVRAKNGILGSIHVGYHCPEDQPRRRLEVIGTRGWVEARNTMGQDPGGELFWQGPGGARHESFSLGAEAGPFVRQLDAVSRLWIRGDRPQFPMERDLDLAELLIHCHAQATLTSDVG